MDARAGATWVKATCERGGVHRRLFSTSVPLALAHISNDDAFASRMSAFWVPTSAIAPVKRDSNDIHARLIRYGFLRQAHSGIFHMLPLGHRVQRKLERLVDSHMRSLGASRLDLSTLSAESLWERSGRLEKAGPELFKLADRKGSPYLLAPTHEEEVTTLVAKGLHSYKELPLRLYQIGRKYRDEMRPRAGMMRAREFTMKDLYTFDYSAAGARAAYQSVRDTYARLFAGLGLPVVAAEASSGDMGGNLSHEYLLPSPNGEDELASCAGCGYAANSDILDKDALSGKQTDASSGACPAIGRPCPRCHDGRLTVQRAIELGHTFYLGTRYSKPLGAKVVVPAALVAQAHDAASIISLPLQMGCHGIGISRLVASAAEHWSPPNGPGISFPTAIAPFEVAILYMPELETDATKLASTIWNCCAADILLDDRSETLPWKLKDADNVGYPIVAIMGKHWNKTREIEVQCKRLGVQSGYSMNNVGNIVQDLLLRLHGGN